MNGYIQRVFCAPCDTAYGGTTSTAVGVIWADPRTTWTSRDFWEFLLHETVHNLLYLDNLRYTHYLNGREMAKSANFVPSAIRAIARPLDKVLHSIVVATEILALRYALSRDHSPSEIHPASETLIAQTEASIRAVDELPTTAIILSSRMLEIHDNCRRRLNEIRA